MAETSKKWGFSNDPLLWARYEVATRDAQVPEEDEITKTLKPITRENKDLVWKVINGVDHVLVTVYTNFWGYDGKDHNEKMSLPVVLWCTPYPYLHRDYILKKSDPPNPQAKTDEEKMHLRIIQGLGLPPDSYNPYFVELWVNPADMLRPSVDNEITDTSAGVADINKESAEVKSHSSGFQKWYTNMKSTAYEDKMSIGLGPDWAILSTGIVNPSVDADIAKFLGKSGVSLDESEKAVREWIIDVVGRLTKFETEIDTFKGDAKKVESMVENELKKLSTGEDLTKQLADGVILLWALRFAFPLKEPEGFDSGIERDMSLSGPKALKEFFDYCKSKAIPEAYLCDPSNLEKDKLIATLLFIIDLTEMQEIGLSEYIITGAARKTEETLSPSLRFEAKSYTEKPVIKAGQDIYFTYDRENRLPQFEEKGEFNTAKITTHVIFHVNGKPTEPSQVVILDHNEANDLPPELRSKPIAVPSGCTQIEMWFENKLPSGATHVDDNKGAHYKFSVA
eukprot:CAMPEP_0168526180 /NCGR_PEP_ID=MMETSP0405-20121227/11804_1 /TAXON_ID=498012 /ORGANISM="Trichosphaerium sp, Strain Am-I-7 wt" /LENGTH=508 /DNA_ID=CAMNT_0008548953 /DNA_START=59 /DNA_END=1587 /DNA_ORIENTATION=-